MKDEKTIKTEDDIGSLVQYEFRVGIALKQIVLGCYM